VGPTGRTVERAELADAKEPLEDSFQSEFRPFSIRASSRCKKYRAERAEPTESTERARRAFSCLFLLFLPLILQASCVTALRIVRRGQFLSAIACPYCP